jgi:hypothetical protein
MTRETAVQELFDVKRKLQRKDDTPNLDAKDEVYEEYSPYFQPENIGDIKQHEIASFLDFENNRHWSGLHRSKNKITRSMEDLRNGLSILVDESRPLAPRFTKAYEAVYGMGTAIASAILHVAYPEKYGVWNNKSEGTMKKLDLWPDSEYGATVGEKYKNVNRGRNWL